MPRLETSGYYALGVPAYFALIGVEYGLGRLRKRRVFGFADTISNLTAGFGELLLGLFLGPVLIGLYDFGFQHLALVHWREDSLWPWLIAFVVSDLCYYWYHRAGHEVALLWTIHGVHHQSREFNVSVAMRHPWLSDVYSAVFYVPLPLLGIPPTHFFVAISVISFYALTIHTRFFHRPALYVLTTPATHVLHHATNPQYLGKNLGAMFNVWDRLFGTYAEPDPAVVPELGMRAGHPTHDGVLSQWVLARRLVASTRLVPSWAHKWRIVLGRPGCLPEGQKLPAEATPRGEASIHAGLRWYVAVQFALIGAVGVELLWHRDGYARSTLLSGSFAVLVGLSSLGGLLDGRRGAIHFEAVRVALTALAGVALWIR